MREALCGNLLAASQAIAPLAVLDALQGARYPPPFGLPSSLGRLRHRLLLHRIHPTEPPDRILLQLNGVAGIGIGRGLVIYLA